MKFALGQGSGAFLVQLRKTQYQNRFIPRREKSPHSWRILLRVSSGNLKLANTVVAPGSWACVSDDVFVPSAEGPSVLATVDADVELLAIRVNADRVPAHWSTVERLDASAEIDETAARFASKLDEVETVEHDFIAGFSSLMAMFQRQRWLSASDEKVEDSLHDPTRLRVQRALTSALGQLALQPMMLDLIEESGVTERQMLRDLTSVQQRFAMFEGGWRETLRWWRLTAAVFLLGNHDRSIAEVARATGYADSSALGRAFRDVGLIAPTQIKNALG